MLGSDLGNFGRNRIFPDSGDWGLVGRRDFGRGACRRTRRRCGDRGGISAFGAAWVNIGVPQNHVIRDEEAIKADEYVLIAHGSPENGVRGQRLVDQAKATESAVFSAN